MISVAGCATSIVIIRGGGIGERTRCWFEKAMSVTESGSSGCGVKKACACPRNGTSVDGSVSRRHRRIAFVPSVPITSGRSITSSTSPRRAARWRSCTSSTSTPASRSPMSLAIRSTRMRPFACSTRSWSPVRQCRRSSVRQRTRAHRERLARLVLVQRGRQQLHRTRLTVAEPVGRVPRITNARRAPRHRAVRLAPRSRTLVGDWRDEYNHYRPHSALGMLTPTEYASRWHTEHETKVT